MNSSEHIAGLSNNHKFILEDCIKIINEANAKLQSHNLHLFIESQQEQHMDDGSVTVFNDLNI